MRIASFLLPVLAFVSATQGADLFPLNPGAVWEYRADGSAEPLVIRVGLNQLYIGQTGRVYSRLTGYVDRPLWVRLNDDGNLDYLDEETSQDRLLTDFAIGSGGWFAAPFRTCEQEGQAHSDRVPYASPTGSIANTVAVTYRTFSCADAGVDAEQFAANVGMVSRSVSTIAGPAVYRLVYADTRALQAAPRNGATLRLSLKTNPDSPSVTATLRLTSDASTPETLAFPTSQEFDMRLRDGNGAVLWTWSDWRVFTPAFHEREAANLVYETEIPLDRAGPPLPAGDYTVEAWLTIADVQRAPRISVALRQDPHLETSPRAHPLRSRRQHTR